MSTPVDPQQPPPPPPPLLEATQQQQQEANPNQTGHGSVGPVIAALFVVTILGVIAGMIGRLCSGRGIFGRGQYDFEGWVERKCASCIDGHVDPHPNRPVHVPMPDHVEEPHDQQEQEEEEEEQQEQEVEATEEQQIPQQPQQQRRQQLQEQIPQQPQHRQEQKLKRQDHQKRPQPSTSTSA